MFTVRWVWNDGSTGEQVVDNKKDAEMMAIQLYSNQLIINVIISDF